MCAALAAEVGHAVGSMLPAERWGLAANVIEYCLLGAGVM